MAGIRVSWIIAVAFLTAAAPRLDAFGRHLAVNSTMPRAPVCQPAPSYWVPAVICPPISAVPIRSGAIYAVPTAAQPSSIQTAEPPTRSLQTPPPPMLPRMKSSDTRDLSAAPTVVAARSLSGNASAPGVLPVPKELCRVGFWNLTGRDVTLVVDGRSHILAKDRAVTLDLRHRFTWRIDTSAEKTEQVGDDQTTHEVVVR